MAKPASTGVIVLKEVLTLGLEEFEGSTDDLPRFIGGQQIEVTV